jgi:hypothetical protein
MKMNTEQSTDKNRSEVVCRILAVLFCLFTFIWLPPGEVKAAGMVSGVVRDSITSDPLPGVTIILNGSFVTESKGAPDEGVYSINHPGSICSLSATLDGYEPFRVFYPDGSGECISIGDNPFQEDIDMAKHVIPYSSSMRLITPSGLIENPRVFRWTRSENPAVVSYRLIISGDPNGYYSSTGIDVIAPQAAGSANSDHDFWRVFGIDQFGDPVEQTREVFEVWSTSQQVNFTVISGLVKSDLNLLGLAGARVTVSSAHARGSDYLTEAVFNGEYIVIALIKEYGDPIPGPIEITSTMVGFYPTTVTLQESEQINNGTITRDLVMESIDGLDGDLDGKSEPSSSKVIAIPAILPLLLLY